MPAELSNFIQGFGQVFPRLHSLSIFSKNKDLQYITQQACRHALRYIAPVIFYYFALLPVLENLGLFIDTSVLQATSWLVYITYCINISAELFLYNTLSIACAAKITVPDHFLRERSLETAYLKQRHTNTKDAITTIPSSIYLLTDTFIASVVSRLNYQLGFITRAHVYGRTLVSSHFNHTGVNIEDVQPWYSSHNLLCLGIGLGFLFSHTIIYSALTNIINLFRPDIIYNLDFLSSYILQDALFSLLWIVAVVNVNSNSPLIYTGNENSLNIYKANNWFSQKWFSLSVDGIRGIIKRRKKNQSPLVRLFLYTKDHIHPTIAFLLPAPLKSTQQLFSSEPIQFYLHIMGDEILKVLDNIDNIKTKAAEKVILWSNYFYLNGAVKYIASFCFHKLITDAIFDLISKEELSTKVIPWLRSEIDNAKLRFIKHRYQQDKDDFVDGVMSSPNTEANDDIYSLPSSTNTPCTPAVPAILPPPPVTIDSPTAITTVTVIPTQQQSSDAEHTHEQAGGFTIDHHHFSERKTSKARPDWVVL